jgi:hypothetical protein
MKLRIASLIALALSTQHADAAIFCVGNTNELVGALSSAQSNSQDDTIMVRTGNIPSPTGGFSYVASAGDANKELDLSGGWNAGCSMQTFDSTLTQLTGADARRVMVIGRGQGTLGELRIRRIQFRNGFNSGATTFDAFGVALRINANQHVGDTLIENCIFNNNSMVNGLASVYIVHKGTLTFRNNLVHGNLSGAETSGVKIDSLSNATASIIGNTITANGSLGASFGGLGFSGSASANALQVLTNNIVWGNNSGNVALDIEGDQGLTLINNNYAGLVAPAGVLINNTTNFNPLFAGSGNFRLSGASPLRDIGNNTPFGGLAVTDLDGGSRVRGAVVDLGPYEAVPEAVFKNGFE